MKKAFILTLLVTIIVSTSAFFFFPQLVSFDEKISLAIPFAVLVPQLVSIWAFLSSLHAFRKELRRAYFLLTAGILLFSINQLQLPVIYMVEQLDPIALSWFISGSTFAGAFLMFISMRKFAQLLDARHGPWGSVGLVTALALVLAFGSTFLPHSPSDYGEGIINGVFGLYVAAGTFAGAATIMAWRIRQRLACGYKAAMLWLVAGMALLAFACFHETFTKLLPIFENESVLWYFVYSVSLWPFAGVAISLLGAGLSFRKISQTFSELPEDAGYLDVITFVAQLASEPKGIDIILDDVRNISAIRAQDSELTQADKSKLLDVYKRLEEHLVTKDPLVKVRREDLRAQLPDEFKQALEGTEPVPKPVTND